MSSTARRAAAAALGAAFLSTPASTHGVTAAATGLSFPLVVAGVVLVASGIATRALDGDSLLASVVGDGVMGGVVFLPIAMLFFVYPFGKQRSAQHV